MIRHTARVQVLGRVVERSRDSRCDLVRVQTCRIADLACAAELSLEL